ncbi:MAG TPA: hypothetical protein VJM32_05485 [Candidatus Saccharimonadales bacterium]|nr:hypothetical protein [Candidatus Saccharimonadales bacterium]
MEYKAPKYKPEQWVAYKEGKSFEFGQVIGGYFITRDGQAGWVYVVKTGQKEDTTNVPEESIQDTFKDPYWKSAHTPRITNV